MDAGLIETRKTSARAWFERLRDDICTALEAIEADLPAPAPFADRAPGTSSARPGSAPITPAPPVVVARWP